MKNKKNIDKNFNKHNETFYLKLETNYPNDNELLTSLVFNYKNVIKLLSGNHVFTIAPWSITPQEFNDFLIKNKSKNYKENLMNESITNRQSYPLKSYDQCVIFEESNFDSSKFIEWFKRLFLSIMPKIRDYFEEDFFVNDKRMRSSLRTLVSTFYDSHSSSIIENSECFNKTLLIKNLIFMLLKEIYEII